MFRKETWDGVKAFFDALKMPLFVLALLLVYLYPHKIKEFAKDAGFRFVDVNLLGIRLEDAAADLEGTGQELADVTAALAERDRLLREIADTSQEPAIREKAQSMLAGAAQITARALAVSDRATIQAAEIGASLQAATQAAGLPAPAAAPPPDTGGYLVVFGADLDIAAALDEVRRVSGAVPEGSGSFALFRKGSFYRSAAVFDSRPARDRYADAIAAAAGRRVEPVTRDRWCAAASPVPEAAAPIPVYQC